MELINRIKEIHISSRGLYGYRRVAAELKFAGEPINHKKVYRLMKAGNICGKYKRKFKLRSDKAANKVTTFVPNILNRNFNISLPNKVWVSDISYIATSEGWLYLAIVLDLYSRKIVGWVLSERMTKAIVTDAFLKAYWSRKPYKGLIHHSDRGSQYRSNSFRSILENLRAIPSMSEAGSCYDNAVAESFFHTLKNEIPNNCIFKTKNEARSMIFEYIETFYNRKRRHSYLGYCTPEEFEVTYFKRVS